MWMQVLGAAGFPVVGEEFPRDWARISARNPRGFFESSLREGINFTTNPDPLSGARLLPDGTQDCAVKIFHRGLPRTERIWLDRVLVTVRDWRSYTASILRFEAHERATFDDTRDPVRVDPAVEWLRENLLTLRDLAARRYPCRFVTREATLADPAAVIGATLAWVGGAFDLAAAVGAVEPSLGTPASLTPPWVPPSEAAVYDAFYAAVVDGKPLRVLAEMQDLEAEIAAHPSRHRARASAYAGGLPI